MSFVKLNSAPAVSMIVAAPKKPEPVDADKDKEAEPQFNSSFMLESIGADSDMSGIMSEAEMREERNLRAQCMGAVIEWAEGAGFSEDFDALARGLADLDNDGEVSEDEQSEYESILNCMVDALIELGVDADKAEAMAENEDDDLAEEISIQVDAAIKASSKGDDELVQMFAHSKALMTEAMRRVVRDGKVKWIKKPLKKKRLSAAQRAALKKARRKAHSGSARRARLKAMRVRKSRGL